MSPITCQSEVKWKKRLVDAAKSVVKSPTNPLASSLEYMDKANDAKTKCALTCIAYQIANNTDDLNAAEKLHQLLKENDCECVCEILW